MECHKLEGKLFDYALDDLNKTESNEIQEHLAKCQFCSAKLEYFKLFNHHLNIDRKIDLPPFFYTRLQSRLYVRSVVAVWLRRLQPIAYSALLLTAIYSGIWMGKNWWHSSSLAGKDVSMYMNEIGFETIEQFIFDSNTY